MSRAGEEMIRELVSLLGKNTVKTAAKKERDDEEGKVPGEQEEPGELNGAEKQEPHEKKDKKEKGKKDKKDKKDKKAACSCAERSAILRLAKSFAESGNKILADQMLKIAYPPGLPTEARDVYNKCKEDDHDDEYCARTAWEAYCQHMNPDDPSCTEAGKTEELSGPKSEADDMGYATAMIDVVNNLSKLATELDEIGAEEASGLVDDALRVIVENNK